MIADCLFDAGVTKPPALVQRRLNSSFDGETKDARSRGEVKVKQQIRLSSRKNKVTG